MFKYWYLPLAKDPAPTLHLYRATDQFQRTTSCKFPGPNRHVFLLKTHGVGIIVKMDRSHGGGDHFEKC